MTIEELLIIHKAEALRAVHESRTTSIAEEKADILARAARHTLCCAVLIEMDAQTLLDVCTAFQGKIRNTTRHEENR